MTASRKKDLESWYIERLRGVPLYVHACFSPSTQLTRASVATFAERLATFVETVEAPVGEYLLLDGSRRTGESLPAEYSYVRIFRVPEQSERSWSVPSAGMVPDCSPRDLQAVMGKKDRRVVAYRQHCDRLWLLIVVNGFAPSASLELPEQTLAHEYCSRFDRVLVLENHRTKVHELTLSA